MTVANERIAVTQYSRQDVLRILRIRAKQLCAWERSGLVSRSEIYSFQDMVQLRKVRDLRATRLSAASIRASVHAMRAVSGMANPLLEAGTARSGARLAFRLSGAMVDPIARQFVFDFDCPRHGQLAEVRDTAGSQAARDAHIHRLFLEGVRREESGNTLDAIPIYERILSLHDAHAPACINLGTIYYNQRQFLSAEKLYRRATIADPNYALAFFDLGNVLDELQRLSEATNAYRSAIRLVPNYADAHYNLALAYERSGERRKALRHWTTYMKLDPVGPWASHARSQARRILEYERLAVVHRRQNAGQPWRSGPTRGAPPALSVHLRLSL